jgi:hypothetical protein
MLDHALAISDLERFEGRFGTTAGQIVVADDFDAPLPPDLERAFEGE